MLCDLGTERVPASLEALLQITRLPLDACSDHSRSVRRSSPCRTLGGSATRSCSRRITSVDGISSPDSGKRAWHAEPSPD